MTNLRLILKQLKTEAKYYLADICRPEAIISQSCKVFLKSSGVFIFANIRNVLVMMNTFNVLFL